MNVLLTIVKIVWASPWTLCGLLLGSLAIATGGGAQRRGKVLEFWGGAAVWLLRHAPIAAGAGAITFGHTVLGQTRGDLDRCRRHELVHVRQYERWGPLFVPAYLLSSLVLWLRGRDPYLENPFEREAYGEDEQSPGAEI